MGEGEESGLKFPGILVGGRSLVFISNYSSWCRWTSTATALLKHVSFIVLQSGWQCECCSESHMNASRVRDSSPIMVSHHITRSPPQKCPTLRCRIHGCLWPVRIRYQNPKINVHYFLCVQGLSLCVINLETKSNPPKHSQISSLIFKQKGLARCFFTFSK